MTGEDDFLEFKRFPSQNLALEAAQILQNEGITVEMTDTVYSVNLTFSSQSNSAHYIVKLRQCDFEAAEEVLKKQLGASLTDVDPDYYLFSFSTDELYDILKNYDQWASHDFDMATEILRNRGEHVTDQELEHFKEKRYAVLAQPDPKSHRLVFFATFTVLSFGLLGAFFGWDLWTATKTLPDGKRVYQYSANDRKTGKMLFMASCATFPISVYLFVLRVFS